MSAHNEFACPTKGCGHIVCLTETLEERLRRTHETFYCPAGHRMSFTGQTDAERTIAKLRESLRTAWRTAGDRALERNEARERLKLCPLRCGFQSRKRTPGTIHRDILWHLVGEHGARLPVADDKAA